MPAPTNTLKAALKRGETQIGCWASLADPYATEVLSTADFDWILIDVEHSPNDLRTIMRQLQVLEGKRANAVVRLPMGEDWLIKQVLDIGAQSLLIPMVESADQARDLVRATRYPPNGIRGSGAAIARASMFNTHDNYIKTADAEICLIVQVESRAGLTVLDDILATEGIDGIFIGPSDLAVDMGYHGDTSQPEVRDAIKDALERISATGKAAGIISMNDKDAQEYAEWGANLLAVGADILMLATAARNAMALWRPRTDR
ncbi:4-hydroxy-2-oxo-heptane-1,7-dioate aldolase [Roseovarius albus]|uniref:Hydroxypyruvate/pyruvate aldolase n=1 Tax=Roseovarius albus TaxID=1247867 RepID=A0A1X6Z5P3_9RHOB|nr:HpcH/HpaI aldolase/citrate lyase family protein [Roseovarius albus]SLN40854.1 4-hydroxy-2-oxo-heptane-1,7-dioate aldolase [Roseovarius albus]